MMYIRISKGIMTVPIKIFYLLLCLVCLLLALTIRSLDRLNSDQDQLCPLQRMATEPPEANRSLPAYHPGCWEEPQYQHTYESCPHCFRPTVPTFSTNFTPLPPFSLLFPRGPPNYFKPRQESQQELIDKVLIAPASVCTTTCPFLLALQLSVANRQEERNTIRATWGSAAKTRLWPHAFINADYQLMFVLGHQSKLSELSADRNRKPEVITTPQDVDRIRTEADRYGDILYLDMVDSYFNLTLKLMSSMAWARRHCPGTKFFLKVDADTFVNVPLLVDLLIFNRDKLDYSILGHIYRDEKHVFRKGRWGVSKKIYPINMFPAYASGCAYVVSSKAVTALVDLFPYFPLLDLEDVYVTGILGKAAKISFFSRDLQGVFTNYHNDRWEWCSFLNDTLVTGTGVNRKFKKNVLFSGFILNDDWICRERNLLRMPCYCQEEFEDQKKKYFKRKTRS